MSHYDPEVDIAALELTGFDGRQAYGEDHAWGVLLRHRASNELVGIELWNASRALPAEVLAALPQLTALPAAAGDDRTAEG